MGFLIMGILDAFVAVSIAGHGFNLFHSLRMVFTGVWFSLVWLPGGSTISEIKKAPWIIASISVLIGYVGYSNRDLHDAFGEIIGITCVTILDYQL
jgi:hypothetical protein